MSKGYYQLKPCPVCESGSGKCRGKEDSGQEFILCMSFADARKGQVINGYKCIKSSNNGYQHNSATFVLDNSQEWTEQQREDWENRKALRRADKRLEEQARKDNALSIDDRHKYYTKILDSLSLDAATVTDLENRGFSQDEIANCGFKSVVKWQKLPFAVDKRLPGIGKDGRSLVVSGEGYLCPLRDYDGKITALQLRLHNPDDSGRYRWVSSPNQTLALDLTDQIEIHRFLNRVAGSELDFSGKELENPLAVFKPEIIKNHSPSNFHVGDTIEALRAKAEKSMLAMETNENRPKDEKHFLYDPSTDKRYACEEGFSVKEFKKQLKKDGSKAKDSDFIIIGESQAGLPKKELMRQVRATAQAYQAWNSAGRALSDFEAWKNHLGWQMEDIIEIPADSNTEFPWVKIARDLVAIAPTTPSIALVEGTGSKPFLASKRLNNIVIGAAGGQFAGSPTLLEDYLRRASEDIGTNKIVIYPDAGDIHNPSVVSRWEELANLIYGYDIKFAWWGQFSKDDCDIDELDDLGKIQFISLGEFLKLAQKETSNTTHQQETKTDNWEQLRAKTATYNLTRKADLIIESGYLPSLKLSDIPSPLLGVKGNCNTGKSVFNSNLLKNWNENIIQVAHLNNLLSNTAPKFDLMHHRELIDDLGVSVAAYSNLAITDISMAAKLDIGTWLGNNRFILVLDEVEQVLKSIQINKNLRGNSLRLKARVKIEWMIKNAAYVICSDRDLCDETIEYIEQIRGEKFYLIHHTGKKGLSKMPVKMVVNKDKTKVLQSLYSDIKKGLKVIIGCENRSDLTAIELELQKKGINDKEILTIHGENSNEKEIKDLIADIDKQYFNYRVFGYTSTLGTGISLDTKHFDKAYYFVSGDVLQSSEIIQLMSRYRPDVNTTIWCNSIVRKLEINPDNLLTDIQNSLKETKGLINNIDKFDYFVKEGIFVNPLGEIPQEDMPWIKHKLSMLARLNASRSNPSKSLYDELIKDGYTIILDDSEAENNYLDAVHKANKDEIKLIQDQAIAKSEVMNDEQYKNARMNPGSLNKEEQARFKKTRLVHELGVHETDVNVSLVELERTKGIVKGAKALKIVLGDKDTALAYDLRDKESNPDPFDQSFYALSWQYFHDLGFDKFLAEINEDFSYSKDSELVVEIADKARKSASKFKRVVGIDISRKKSDCAIIGHLLDKLCILREEPNKAKNKARIYKINMSHYQLLINAVEHINRQEKTLTMERLINNKIDQTMVSECAEVIRLAFEVADNPVDEYELIKSVGEDKPKAIKKLIFNRLTEDEQNRVKHAAKTVREMVIA